MAKIFYSLSGEGRGHASRVKAAVDELRISHKIRIYAPGVAHQFLNSAYQNTEVEVKKIPGLCFNYSVKNRLNYLNTGWDTLSFFGQAPRVLDRLQRDIETETPDLAITDFEPLLPRAANRCRLPFISLNHQHFKELIA